MRGRKGRMKEEKEVERDVTNQFKFSLPISGLYAFGGDRPPCLSQ